MRYRQMLIPTAAMALMATLALVNPSGAQAAQPGLQQIHVPSTSRSSVYTNFDCGVSYSVPVGPAWGEGQANPRCGTYTYQQEPAYIYVGPGWCVTRWIQYTSGATSATQYDLGGGSGGWFRIWSDNIGDGRGYTNNTAAWYGSWCPTSGASYVSGPAI